MNAARHYESLVIDAMAALEEIGTLTDMLLEETALIRVGDDPEKVMIYRMVRLINSRANAEVKYQEAAELNKDVTP